jgi:methionine salvage enolase-phosphatase E1
MEGSTITAISEAVINIERIGTIGALVFIVGVLLYYNKRDKNALAISEAQVAATEKMSEVMKVHNDTLEKLLANQQELLTDARDRLVELKTLCIEHNKSPRKKVA